jgi:hypothetical protein
VPFTSLLFRTSTFRFHDCLVSSFIRFTQLVPYTSRTSLLFVPIKFRFHDGLISRFIGLHSLVSFTIRTSLLFRTIKFPFHDRLVSSFCHASLMLGGDMIRCIYFPLNIDMHVIYVSL